MLGRISFLWPELRWKLGEAELVSHIDGFVTRVAPTWPRSQGPVNSESAPFIYATAKNEPICYRWWRLVHLSDWMCWFLFLLTFASVDLSLSWPMSFHWDQHGRLLGLVAYIMIIRCTAYKQIRPGVVSWSIAKQPFKWYVLTLNGNVKVFCYHNIGGCLTLLLS